MRLRVEANERLHRLMESGSRYDDLSALYTANTGLVAKLLNASSPVNNDSDFFFNAHGADKTKASETRDNFYYELNMSSAQSGKIIVTLY